MAKAQVVYDILQRDDKIGDDADEQINVEKLDFNILLRSNIMTEFTGVHNNERMYETCETEAMGAARSAVRSLGIPSPYGDHGDYPIGYQPPECDGVDPPFSSTRHQKAMAAVMEIMSLLITIGSSLRAALRNAKKAASLDQIGKLLEAADKLRDAAACALVAGIVEGAMSIAGGYLEVRGALKAMKEMKKIVTAVDWKKFDSDAGYASNITQKLTKQMDGVTNDLRVVNKPDASKESKEIAKQRIDQHIIAFAQRGSQKMDQISMLYRACSQLCQALGSIGRGISQFNEKIAEADGQELQALATQHEFDKDQWGDLKKEIDELLSTLLNVIKSIHSGSNQTINSILH